MSSEVDLAEPIDPDIDLRVPSQRRELVRTHGAVLVVIALGGGFGAIARYGLAELLPTQPDHFPWATFLPGDLVQDFPDLVLGRPSPLPVLAVQGYVRRADGVSWQRWTVLAMLDHAFLAVLAATERDHNPTPNGLIPLTCNEIHRLSTSSSLSRSATSSTDCAGPAGEDDTNTAPGSTTTSDEPQPVSAPRSSATPPCTPSSPAKSPVTPRACGRAAASNGQDLSGLFRIRSSLIGPNGAGGVTVVDAGTSRVL